MDNDCISMEWSVSASLSTSFPFFNVLQLFSSDCLDFYFILLPASKKRRIRFFIDQELIVLGLLPNILWDITLSWLATVVGISLANGAISDRVFDTGFLSQTLGGISTSVVKPMVLITLTLNWWDFNFWFLWGQLTFFFNFALDETEIELDHSELSDF